MRATATNLQPLARVEVDRAADRPFDNFGEQLLAIAAAGMSQNVTIDPRLKRVAVASGMSESIGSEGGFAVQSDFVGDMLYRAYNTGEILSRVRRLPIGAGFNGLKVDVIDETSRATGSRLGGVQVYWVNEADTVTAKKPKLRQLNLSLKKVMGICYMTDELFQDATSGGEVITQAFAEEITFVAEDAILASGSGAGQPASVLGSGALITVAKESAQAANTFVAANAANMYSRMWAPSRKQAAWFVNQDIDSQLVIAALSGTGVAFPGYLPPGMSSETPYGTLLGRPVIPVECCSAFSSLGDVIFADLNEYLVIDREIKKVPSIHVRFIYDEMTFKISYRFDGQPIWNSPLTPKNGTNTQSPFVTLAAR